MADREPQPQSVTSAWVQLLRREIHRMQDKELSRVGCVGLWMSTFANADGTSVTVGREHLAILSGMSKEAVSRAQRVLEGVGMVRARRRPNQNTERILTIPSDSPDWKLWLPEFSETRHKRRHREAKLAKVEEMFTPADGARARPPDDVRACGPDSVRAGASDPAEGEPDSVRARHWTASMHAVRTACAPGGTMSHLPPVVTSTSDLDTPQLSPQPQVGALLGSAKIDQPDGGWGTTSCPRCGARVVSRPGRSVCVACLREEQ